MMFRTLAIGALAAPLALAAPTKRQDIDTTVLQFALTLEHLENVFYKGALQQFSEEDFKAAGYGPNFYNNLKYIASDEESHTKFLTAALQQAGASPNAACEYNFPYTDVKSFIGLSTVLEGVGTSAYLGGAPLITNKDYLTAAGSILVSEALHTSLLRSTVKAIPNANAYGTPLGPNAVFTLAAGFIKSCPSSNQPLPFTGFPTLTADSPSGFCESPNCNAKVAKRDDSWGKWKTCNSGETLPSPPSAGDTVSFTSAVDIPAGSFVTFVSGLQITSVPGTITGRQISAAIPAGVSGQTYVLITKSAVTGKLADDQVVAGPAVIEVKPAPPSIDYSYRK